jgi:threonyl-tRNA synthetase
MTATVTVHVEGKGQVSLARGSSVREALGVDADCAVAAVVDGHTQVDLSRSVAADCVLRPILADEPEGLEVLRHSTAHVLAQAVKRLYPAAQVTIGPVIEDGFYYDFKYDPGFAPEDLEKISAEMHKIVAENLAVSREELTRAEAVTLFSRMGEDFKCEIVRGLGDATVSLYRQGEFVDLCRGPHVPSTGRLGCFKLTHVAGAYWRGDERNAMLQRIYGTAFADQQSLAEHLDRLEEARRRDHRRLGKQLGLFSFHAEAPGCPFFLPDGAFLYQRLVEYVRGLYRAHGYREVITPQVLDLDLWRRSGHYEHYKENMYFTDVEDRHFAVKPMNCPTHCLIYGEDIRSYRDLPLRYADFGRLHRYERSGVMHGLTRVRSFSQDDAHVFCTPEQVQQEVSTVIRMIAAMQRDFGFGETRVYLSTRPANSIGDDAMWERAEATLRQSIEAEGLGYTVNPGDGAFYGPKIDFCVLDAVKRQWQLSTVQLDFSMPERFGLTYVDSDGRDRRPVMIHRAILGSLERFIGILVEHTAGAFPIWLAPWQVRLVTVSDRQNDYAAKVARDYETRGIRAWPDLRNQKLGFKIREAQQAKVPVIAVIGDREVENGTVSPRLRDGRQLDAMSADAFGTWVLEHAVPGDGGVP